MVTLRIEAGAAGSPADRCGSLWRTDRTLGVPSRQRFDSPTQASQEREVVRGPVVGPDRVGAQSGATSMPWHATVASPHSEFGEGVGVVRRTSRWRSEGVLPPTQPLD